MISSVSINLPNLSHCAAAVEIESFVSYAVCDLDVLSASSYCQGVFLKYLTALFYPVERHRRILAARCNFEILVQVIAEKEFM